VSPRDHRGRHDLADKHQENNVLKLIGGTIGIIFLIGLAVVIGLFALIF
jgi:hypothetical protein